jgi:hemerythrin
MPLMTWTPKLSVGVAVLDEDHKKLVGMVNELYDAMQAGHGKESLGPILGRLVDYTVPHKQQHDALTHQVLEVQRKYAAGAAATVSLEVMHFLRDWLINHIQGTDQKYRAHLNAKGIH